MRRLERAMKQVLMTACLFMCLCGCAHDPRMVVLSPEEGRRLSAIERSLVPSDSPEAPPQPIEERLRHWHVPAVSVAVFGDGRVKWAKAWGVADASTGDHSDSIPGRLHQQTCDRYGAPAVGR